jgi:hypothetical protein
MTTLMTDASRYVVDGHGRILLSTDMSSFINLLMMTMS